MQMQDEVREIGAALVSLALGSLIFTVAFPELAPFVQGAFERLFGLVVAARSLIGAMLLIGLLAAAANYVIETGRL